MPRRRDPGRPPLDETGLADLLRQQGGLVCRSQLTALGAAKFDVDRLLRQRRLVRCADGVYVGHTGELTSRQHQWVAVLSCGTRACAGTAGDRGAALVDESALSAARGRDTLGDIHVAVEAQRNLSPPDGTRLHRVSGLRQLTLWNASPPRMRPEHAALRVASRASDDGAAVGVLTDVLGDRLTTAARLREALAGLPSLPRRAWLARVLDDLALGTCSVLEHTFLTRVERSHGLPRPTRQVRRRGADGTEYRDAEYDELALVLGLDGKAFHEGSRARDRDYERELDDHVAGKPSVRLGWGQVASRPCRTALKLSLVMRRHGWTGAPVPCGPECAIQDAGFGAEGSSDEPSDPHLRAG